MSVKTIVGGFVVTAAFLAVHFRLAKKFPTYKSLVEGA